MIVYNFFFRQEMKSCAIAVSKFLKHVVTIFFFIFQIFTTSQESTPTCKCRNIDTIARFVILWKHRQRCLAVQICSIASEATIQLRPLMKCLDSKEIVNIAICSTTHWLRKLREMSTPHRMSCRCC